MPDPTGLGEFEFLVMCALLHLGEDAYGMRVRQEIAQRTNRDVSIGAVYATLDRLETKGLVDSHAAEPTTLRGGRAKRIFQPTARGQQAVALTRETFRRMLEGLDLQWSE
jgi:PadR family transcriptional regulator, regulatory protein PadR